MEKQFFEGKENVLHSFDLDFLRGVNLEALYYNIIVYIYDSSKNSNREIELNSRKEEIEEMLKKKEKFLLAPREQKEEFICVLLTHNSSRSSFLVAIFERGNRGDQASIRPWRLANYYNYRNWRCAIRPGKGQSRAPLRGYSSPPSLLHTKPIFILACRVSIINTTTALLYTHVQLHKLQMPAALSSQLRYVSF